MVSICQLLHKIFSLKSFQFFSIVIFFVYVSTDLSHFSSLCYLCSFCIPEFSYGLVVRIPVFHPGAPGSTPDMRTLF